MKNENYNSVTLNTDTSVENEEDMKASLDAVEQSEKEIAELDKPELFSQKDETEEKTEEKQEAEDESVEDDDDVEEMSFEDMAAEFEANGTLSDESFKALEDMGIPRSYVDQYLAGLDAQREVVESKAYAMAGGKENYESMLEWAGNNLADEAIDEFNEAVNSLDAKVRDAAIQRLVSTYQEEVGTGGNLLMGGAPKSGVDAYSSFEQLVADQSDPRYDNDPAFREAVLRKLSRSNLS